MSVPATQDTGVWDPLLPGQIRLLRIDSGPEPVFRCTLQPHDLHDDTRQWYALSYVWGTDAPSLEICLNDKRFYVTPTLHAALIAIGKHVKKDDCEWLWIDAICINQRDDDEKSKQIPHMGDVYSGAKMVVVWFDIKEDRVDVRSIFIVLNWVQANLYTRALNGDTTRDCGSSNASRTKTEGQQAVDKAIQLWSSRLELAVETLRTEHGISRTQVAAFGAIVEASYEREDAWTREDMYKKSDFGTDLFGPEHDFWLALAVFMVNPWFERVWTYQEIILASHAILVHNGGVVCWNIIRECRNTALKVAARILDFSKMRLLDLDFTHLLESLTSDLAPDAGRRRQLERSTFPFLLRQTGMRKANDPKDSVYGLLGLLDDATRSELLVDYSSSTAQIFHAAIGAVVQRNPQELPSIWKYFESSATEVQGLVSWCPDFSQPPNGDQSTGWDAKLNDAVVQKYKGLVNFSFSKNLASISCKVLLLDRIIQCVAGVRDFRVWDVVASLYDTDDAFQVQFSKSNRVWLRQMNRLLGPSGIADLFAAIRGKPESDLGATDQARGIASLLVFCLNIDLYNIKTMQEAHNSLGLSGKALHDLRMDMVAITSTLAGRYTFRTALGKTGVSYKPIDQGDHIVLVPGGESLFAISKEQNKYRGPAYVHGLMEDSLLDLSEHPDAQWIDICLS